VGAIGKLNLFRVYVEVEAEDRPQSAARQGKRFSKPIEAEALSAHRLISGETLCEASDNVRGSLQAHRPQVDSPSAGRLKSECVSCRGGVRSVHAF
jgi:hypothetical protein